MPARIALVHATELAVEPINQAFAELYPEAQLSNILDDSLLSDLGANGGEVAPELLDRLASLVRYGETAGADAVLLTCSSFGPAAAGFGELVDVPFFRADDALIDAALQRGDRVGVVATVPSAVATAEQALESAAAAAGRRIEISSVLCAESFAALKDGDRGSGRPIGGRRRRRPGGRVRCRDPGPVFDDRRRRQAVARPLRAGAFQSPPRCNPSQIAF